MLSLGHPTKRPDSGYPSFTARTTRVRRMIAKEDTPLTAIASKCGFQNLSHFSKAFKQQYGVSPMQFRKNNDNISQT